MILSLAVMFCCTNGVAWAAPSDASASGSNNCEHSILGLRPWYAGLDMEDGCTIASPSENELPAFVWKIVLNVLTDAFMVAGYVAVGFVVFGGYKYLMSGGEPSKVAQGKQTITNAIVGLIIAMLATLITNLAIMILNGATK